MTKRTESLNEELEEEENEVEEGVKPIHQIQAVIAPEGDGDVELTIESIQEAVANSSAIDNQELYDPTLELSTYQRPPIELLEEYKNQTSPVSNEELIENKNKIVETLAEYTNERVDDS